MIDTCLNHDTVVHTDAYLVEIGFGEHVSVGPNEIVELCKLVCRLLYPPATFHF